MAQVLQFGRAGLSSASGGDGLELHCRDWKWRGDTATVTLIVRKQSSIADAKALVAQCLGYDLNTDEPVIPVTWSEDSSVDGFYRVQSVEADAEMTGRLGAPTESGKNTAWTLTAELLRVPGWQAPLFEITSYGAARGGGGVSSGDPWCAVPYSTSASVMSGDPTNGNATLVTTDAGGIVLVYSGSGFDYLYDGWVTYYCNPEDFFNGTCALETTSDSGSTWRTVVGRQMPKATDSWRITNHRTRVSLSSGNLRVGWWDGSSWETTDFVMDANPSAGAPSNTFTSWQVAACTRNSPETVSVKLTSFGAFQAYATLDLTIRRGGTLIEGVFYSPGASGGNLGVWRTASEAGTAITGGIEATTAVAGNKYVMLSPDTITKDVTGQSGIYLTSVGSTFHFAVGVNNSALDSNITIQEQYFAANQVLQGVVAR